MAECGHAEVYVIFDSKAECKWRWTCKRCGAPFVPYNFGDEQKHPDSAILDALLDPEGPFVVFVRAKQQGSDKYVFVDGLITTRADIDEVIGRADDGE